MYALTFNGADKLRCSGDIVISGHSEAGNSVFLHAADDRGDLWEAGPLFIGPDPQVRFAGPNSVDLVAAYWKVASAVVILGDSVAYVIDEPTGDSRAAFSLNFIGKSSLDVAMIAEVGGGDMLLLVSTKRAVLINGRLEVIGYFEPEIMLTAPPRIGESVITFFEYDLEGGGRDIEEMMPIP